MEKFVYSFEEGNKDMKQLLGGKGANLAEMTSIGLPVPPGFTVTTEACHQFYLNGKKWPEGLFEQVGEKIAELENKMNLELGNPSKPLLVSVRSGAAVSMPGMMDTILNLGLNDETIKGLIEVTKNERFALDSYRRFIQMFSNVVMNVEHRSFEHVLEKKKETKGIKFDTELTTQDLREIIQEYKEVIKKEKAVGRRFKSCSGLIS